jgi:cytidine deaminase
MDKKQIEEMIDLAVRQLDYSYAPYSNFHVGAALLAKNGITQDVTSKMPVTPQQTVQSALPFLKQSVKE